MTLPSIILLALGLFSSLVGATVQRHGRDLENVQNAPRVEPGYFSHHDDSLLSVLFTADARSAAAPIGDSPPLRLPLRLANLSAAPYAEWAHYHWVWLSANRATQAKMTEYAQEYLDHTITVGAIDIDSGWETGFNNFKPNLKYPNISAMVDWCHFQGIKVIFWITSMVDVDSDNYNYGEDHDYYIKDILGKPGHMKWWHGNGSLLDYTNVDARNWWHKQMDQVLAAGIDGWKCDGTDPYILELVDARGKSGHHVTYRDYADGYYGDFLDHTRAVRGQEALIMSRPVDSFGPLYLKFSPPRVMFSGWVGDADPTFDGLVDTLKRYLQSAWAGYANFGSDIGGYRHGNGTLGRTKELFVRWAQLGAFSPLMENGGDAEHRPWVFDESLPTATPSVETIYKGLVETHYQLVPYLLTTGTLAYRQNKSSILPLAPHENFIEKLVDDFKPATLNYLLGPNILVAPITSDPAQVHVTFPHVTNSSEDGSENDTFVAWWNATLHYDAGQSVQFEDLPLSEFTAFMRAGHFLPLRPAPHSSARFSNAVRRDWLQLHLHSPHSTVPDPVQVVDDESGLVAAYWRTPVPASGNASRLMFVTTAHRSLKVSLHVFFGVGDPLSPCSGPLAACRCETTNGMLSEHGDACAGSCAPIESHGGAWPDAVGAADDTWHEHPAMTAYAQCEGEWGRVVVKHGAIPDGLLLSIAQA